MLENWFKHLTNSLRQWGLLSFRTPSARLRKRVCIIIYEFERIIYRLSYFITLYKINDNFV